MVLTRILFAARKVGFDVLLTPSDTDDQRYRKAIVGANFLLMPMFILCGIIVLVDHIATGYVSSLLLFVSTAIGSVCITIAWFMTKKSKFVSDTGMVIIAGTLFVMATLAFAANTMFAIRAHLIINLLGFLMTNTKFGLLYVIPTLAAYAVVFDANIRNDGSNLLTGYSTLEISDSITIVSEVSAFLPIFFVFCGFAYFRAQHQKKTSAMTDTLNLFLSLNENIRNFDIATARQLARHYREQGSVDSSLLSSLDSLLKSLEVYRPHIPNYVIDEMRAKTSNNHNNNKDQKQAASKNNSNSTAVDLRGGGGVVSSHPASPRSALLPQQNKVSDRLVSIVYVDFYEKLDILLSRAQSAQSRGEETVNPLEPTSFESNVDADTMAAMEGGFAEINSFVDAVYTNAERTRGSVHTFVGDVARLTWNATHNVKQHEMKAARFLLSCQDIKSMVCGAAHTATAWAQFAGSKNSTQTVLLHMPSLSTLDTLFHFARRYNIVVTSGETFNSARWRVEGRAVQAIGNISAGSFSATTTSSIADQSKQMSANLVYEITSEREDVTTQAFREAQPVREWNEQITQSTIAAASGRLEEALGRLDCVPQFVLDTPCVRALERMMRAGRWEPLTT
eukprot:PhM_4_TR13270/c0_g1_i1/m.105777